jgi:hypothetical protein
VAAHEGDILNTGGVGVAGRRHPGREIDEEDSFISRLAGHNLFDGFNRSSDGRKVCQTAANKTGAAEEDKEQGGRPQQPATFGCGP